MRPHRASRVALTGAAALLALALSGCGRDQPESGTLEPLADFERRVQEYAALRNRLADSLGTVDETKSQPEIAARAAALAAAIANARIDARPGDLFTPEAAVVIATVIKEDYRRRSDSVLQSRQDHADEYKTDGLPPFDPQVNRVFPTTHPLPTFDPLLLPVLPKLPPQIEYRRMEHYLLLRDVEANLIVDYMPNAFPR